MNMKTTMIALAALAMSGPTHAITSEEIATVLDGNVGAFSLSGVSDWLVTNSVSHRGGASMQSGAVPADYEWKSSVMTMSVDVKESSELSFWYKVSCYGNTSYAQFKVIIDNTTYTYCGEIDWTKMSCVLLPGSHTISYELHRYRYNGGANCAWVDDISIEPIMPTASKVEVTNIKCQQRYPWNGMVDIDYTVKSEDPNAEVWVYPIGYDKDSNTSMAPRALAGDGVNAPVKAGTHRMTWTVTEDYPDFHSTAFTVKMIALVGAAPYMVVDLSGGVDAISYPVSYLSSVPEGGWGDEYKTTKLVLRLIPPGSFMMGSPSDELGRDSNENLHGVVLTKPFYIGIFELTQKQWKLVMGTQKPGSSGSGRVLGDDIPANEISYNEIRGAINGVGWPTHNQVDANSFMGRLRSKVNMLFDLPTEAQWEYACRAGTSTSLNNGKNITVTEGRCVNLDEVAWYSSKSSSYCPTTVGRFMPNAWGLYDMHGNVQEWCRDFYSTYKTLSVVDPKGSSSSSDRIVRGGGSGNSWGAGDYGTPQKCRSASRWSRSPSSTAMNSGFFGFRVMCSPVAE